MVLGIVGLSTASNSMIDTAYDVLGLEAVFLVPRIFSLLSLNPYFGTLVSLRDHEGTFRLHSLGSFTLQDISQAAWHH